MNCNTLDVLEYIVRKHSFGTITILVKICYLFDLIWTRENGAQYTDLSYIRYFYGPYDKKIEDYVGELERKGKIESVHKFSENGEYVVYKGVGDIESSLPAEVEKTLAALIDEVQGYGPKTLAMLTYKTAPMVKLGATFGGKENLGKPLNLKER